MKITITSADSSAENTPNDLEFICPSPKVLNFKKKRLHWAAVVCALDHYLKFPQNCWKVCMISYGFVNTTWNMYIFNIYIMYIMLLKYYSTMQEYIRKDKQKESSEANSAWDVAKLAVFKQPAWYQSDCSKIMHFRQQMAPKSTIYPALWRPLYPVFGTFNEKFLRTFGIFFRIWGFWWAHLIRNFTRISEIFKFCL